jgi:hypothetical protein
METQEQALGPQEQALGPHLVQFDPPSTVTIRWRGEFKREHVDEFRKFAARLRAAKVPSCYVVVDARAGEGINAEARRHIVALFKERYFHATICVQGSFRFRVLAELMANAVKILVKDPIPLVFVDSEQAAHDWIRTHAVS